jgi:hypothetical protein
MAPEAALTAQLGYRPHGNSREGRLLREREKAIAAVRVGALRTQQQQQQQDPPTAGSNGVGGAPTSGGGSQASLAPSSHTQASAAAASVGVVVGASVMGAAAAVKKNAKTGGAGNGKTTSIKEEAVPESDEATVPSPHRKKRLPGVSLANKGYDAAVLKGMWPRLDHKERARLLAAVEAVMATDAAEPFVERPVTKVKRFMPWAFGRKPGFASASAAALVPDPTAAAAAANEKSLAAAGTAVAAAAAAGDSSSVGAPEGGESRKRARDDDDDGQIGAAEGLSTVAASATETATEVVAPVSAEKQKLPETSVVPAPVYLELIAARLLCGYYRHYGAVLSDCRRIYFNAAE